MRVCELPVMRAAGDLHRARPALRRIEHFRWGGHDSLIYWIARCSPVKCTGEHFRGAWSWHAAAAFGLLGGRLAHRILGTPVTKDEGAGLLLTARRAGQEISQQ